MNCFWDSLLGCAGGPALNSSYGLNMCESLLFNPNRFKFKIAACLNFDSGLFVYFCLLLF